MLLDKYIFRLWLGPFAGFLAVATGVLLLGRALKVLGLIADRGVDWSVMLALLLAILPYFLVLTLPIAFFYALQSVVIRLHQDSEIDAFRASGISYLRLFRVMFAVAAVLWLVLTYTAMEWMPKGQKAFQTLFYAVQKAKPAPGFDAQRFNRDLEHFTVYVEGEDDRGRLHGFILEDDRSKAPIVYMAEWAEIGRVGRQLQFTLHRGTRLEGAGESLRSLAFEEYRVAIDIAELGLLKIPKWRNRAFEMDMFELWDTLKIKASSEAAAEWHRRWLLSTTVWVLLLFAPPLSVSPKRSGRMGAFLLGTAVLLVVYNMQIILHQQVQKDLLPWWSMWAGQLVLLSFAWFLFARMMRDRLPSMLYQTGEIFYLVHQRIQHALASRLGKH